MAWKDELILYWANSTNPMVALTSTSVHGIAHVTGSVNGLQIGNQNGIIPALCTGYITAGTCSETQNCVWGKDHGNEYNDTLLYVACRPITLGITPIAATPAIGSALTWFSTKTKTWFSGEVTQLLDMHDELLGDGTHAQVGTVIMFSQQSVSNESGSPVFTLDGDFIGSVRGLGNPGFSSVHWAFPDGAQLRTAPVPDVFSNSVYDYDED